MGGGRAETFPSSALEHEHERRAAYTFCDPSTVGAGKKETSASLGEAKGARQKRFKYAWRRRARNPLKTYGTELSSIRAGGGGKDHRNGSDNYLRGRRAAIFSLNKHQAFPLEGARNSVPVARGRRPEESCIARAPACPSARHIAVCVHAATSSKSCISGCVLLPHTCYGLSALNLSPEAPLHNAERISQRG